MQTLRGIWESAPYLHNGLPFNFGHGPHWIRVSATMRFSGSFRAETEKFFRFFAGSTVIEPL